MNFTKCMCDEIDNLIMKYEVDKHYPRFRKNIIAKRILSETFKNMTLGMKVVLVGLKKEDIEYVCECIPDSLSVQNIVWKGTDERIASVNHEQNKIFVVSREGGTGITKKLRKDGVTVTNIYEIFEQNQLFFEDEFYRIFFNNVSYMSCDNENDYRWDQLYQMEYSINLQNFEKSKDSYLKCIYAEKNVFLALYVRDFLLFRNCVKQAKENNSEIDFDDLIGEIDAYLFECEKKLKARTERDILTFWIDAVPYGETDNMPYWSELKHKAVSFERAYCVTPNTKPTFRSMFCEKREITDRGYKISEVNEKNSRLIHLLKKNNYKIMTISGYFGEIAKKTQTKKVFGFRAPTSMILWHMVMQLLEEDKKQFIICHFFTETHYPYISMGVAGYDKNEQTRRIAGEKKTDQQLQYYSRFMPPEAVRIYMSDHGKGRDIKAHHINFDIVSNKLKPNRIDKLFSILDFYHVIKSIVEMKHKIMIDTGRKSIPIETLDYYSKRSTISLLTKKILLEPYQFGYIGEINEKYLGICFSTGIKWAVSMETFWTSFPNSYMMRQAVGVPNEVFDDIPEFPYEILDDERFIYARWQHCLFDRYINRIKERMREIKKIISKYKDGEIAIRTGGFHSLILFDMLSTREQVKIGCFIDDNANCLCKGKGKIVLSIHDFLENKNLSCKAIILSSYIHIEELRCEVDDCQFDDYEIIDIYKIFDEIGIEYRKDFFYALYDSDYFDVITKII